VTCFQPSLRHVFAVGALSNTYASYFRLGETSFSYRVNFNWQPVAALARRVLTGGTPFRVQPCFREAMVYQIPEATKTTAQAPVNRMRNGEGSMNHATMAAAPDNAPQR